jgi:hypothetical protein
MYKLDLVNPRGGRRSGDADLRFIAFAMKEW